MSKRILVIDDDEGIVSALEVVLSDVGYQVETMLNPEQLLTHSLVCLPDLILIDVLLSGADGRTICRRLKTNAYTKKIPIIMISAATNIEKSVKDSFADEFISKPFEIDNLLSTVKRYIE